MFKYSCSEFDERVTWVCWSGGIEVARWSADVGERVAWLVWSDPSFPVVREPFVGWLDRMVG